MNLRGSILSSFVRIIFEINRMTSFRKWHRCGIEICLPMLLCYGELENSLFIVAPLLAVSPKTESDFNDVTSSTIIHRYNTWKVQEGRWLEISKIVLQTYYIEIYQKRGKMNKYICMYAKNEMFAEMLYRDHRSRLLIIYFLPRIQLHKLKSTRETLVEIASNFEVNKYDGKDEGKIEPLSKYLDVSIK